MARHETSLSFSYDDQHRARVVELSVGREIGEIDGDRSFASVDRSGETVEVMVRASDLVALRAGLNTWLGLVEVAERSADAADGSVSRTESSSPAGPDGET